MGKRKLGGKKEDEITFQEVKKMKWKYTRRTINGHRVKAKVHRKQDGTYLVRKVGFKNRHD